MAAAATVGLTAYSMIEGRKAARAAKKEANQAKATSEMQQAELVAEQNRQRRLKGNLALATRTALLAGARGGGNRGGSILTSPLGVTGNGGGYGSNVLGA